MLLLAESGVWWLSRLVKSVVKSVELRFEKTAITRQQQQQLLPKLSSQAAAANK